MKQVTFENLTVIFDENTLVVSSIKKASGETANFNAVQKESIDQFVEHYGSHDETDTTILRFENRDTSSVDFYIDGIMYHRDGNVYVCDFSVEKNIIQEAV
jgi:hypothetical protein